VQAAPASSAPNLSIINSGSISGGLAGDGVTRANAITFTGGTNTLQLQAGYSFSGNVVDQTGNGTLQFGGSTNPTASFDVSLIGAAAQYRGFASFEKTGASTWTLSGTNSAALPWSIAAGTLLVNGSLAIRP
jgi:autotransporter-associated beta strand protein